MVKDIFDDNRVMIRREITLPPANYSRGAVTKSKNWTNSKVEIFANLLGIPLGEDFWGSTEKVMKTLVKYYFAKKESNFHEFLPVIYSFKERNTLEEWLKTSPQGSFSYCDSSIWQIDGSFWKLNENTDAEKLVQHYREQGRYDLLISYEFAELHERKFINSYIEGDSHGSAVCPFVFHSEGALCKGLTIEGFNNELFFLRKNLENYKWNILLVDDHALGGLKIIEGNNFVKSKFGKAQFIEEDIKYVFPQLSISYSSDVCEKQNIIITCVDSVAAALGKLKEGYRYDIVLLDYKFDKASDKERYGTNLLTKIKADDNIKPCPAGKYNFLFVSGYPDAVHDSMNAEGIYSDTDKWFVRRGACPINTPYLFLYELLRLMEHRVKPLMEHVTMVQNNSKTQEDAEMLKSPSALSYIKWLYSSRGEKAVRDRCKNAFNAFLALRSTYDIIKYDVCDSKKHKNEKGEKNDRFVDSQEKESRLIRSMFPDVVCYSNTFWEHMQHLIYLTAYGTNRQWPEMWEEMLSVSDYLKNAGEKIKTESGVAVVRLIRRYILNLKSENSR